MYLKKAKNSPFLRSTQPKSSQTSRRSAGNKITFRIPWLSVGSINRQSIPTPLPEGLQVFSIFRQ